MLCRMPAFILHLIGLLLLLSACQSAEPPPATLFILPTPLPASETPEPTRTPLPTPVPTEAVPIGNLATDPERVAYLRAAHAAPDAAPVDIYVNSAAFSVNLTYGQLSGKTNILAGEYTLSVRPVGDANTILTEIPLSIQPGQAVLMAVLGTRDVLAARTFTETPDPLRARESRVYFINATTDTVTAYRDGTPISADLPPLSSSGPRVTLRGDASLSFQMEAISQASVNVTLQERSSYTYILIGDPGNRRVLSYNERIRGDGQIRVIHAASGVEGVDVLVDDNVITAGIANGTATERVSIAPGQHVVSVYAAGVRDNPLIDNLQFNINPDDTVALIVLAANGRARLVTHREDLAPTLPESARASFVNGRPETVRVGLGSALREDIPEQPFARAGDPVDILPDTTQIFWQDTASGQLVSTVDSFSFEVGQTYLLIVTPDGVLTFVEEVGIDESAPVVIIPTPTPIPPTFVRFVNAMVDGTRIDLLLDGAPLAQALAPGQSTVPTIFAPRAYTLELRLSDQSISRLNTTLTSPPSGYYTIYFYNTAPLPLFVIIPDGLELYVDDLQARVRLVNLSLDESVVFRGVSAPATSPEIFATPPDRVEDRATIPLGVTDITNPVPARSASELFNLSGEPIDLLIVDGASNRVAQRVRSLFVQPGLIYDVIAYQVQGELEVRTFIVTYPIP